MIIMYLFMITVCAPICLRAIASDNAHAALHVCRENHDMDFPHKPHGARETFATHETFQNGIHLFGDKQCSAVQWRH